MPTYLPQWRERRIMRRSAALLMCFSLALLLTPFISTSAKTIALAWELPKPSSSFLVSALNAIVSPDGSVIAQAAFLAPNNTLRVRGIKPEEVGYPGQDFPYPHGLEALALWARKGTLPVWGSLSGLLGGGGWPGGGGLLPFLLTGTSFGIHGHEDDQLFQPPDKDKMMSMFFSPGLWLGMAFVGLSNEEDLFKAKAEQLASSVSDAYGVDMWLYMSFSFPIKLPEVGHLHEKGHGASWPKNYMGFLFVYYADADLEGVADGFIEQLPDGTVCELVKDTTLVSEAPYALYAYAMVDARLVALLIMMKQGSLGSFGNQEPWPYALLAHDEHDDDGIPDFEPFKISGWMTLWFSERFILSGVQENQDGTYMLSLNALFGHSGPICVGDLPDVMEMPTALLVEIPWLMEVISVEPDDAEIRCFFPHFTTVSLLLEKGECVDDLIVVFEPRTSFPILLLRQYADKYVVEQGGEVSITVCMENVGNATAYDVLCIAGLRESSGGWHGHGAWGGDQGSAVEVFTIDEIPPGQVKTFNFTLSIEESVLLMPAIAIYFLEPTDFKINGGETSLEDLREHVHEFKTRPSLVFFCESNTIEILTSNEEAPSLLAFLELDKYILREGELLNATLFVQNVGNAPAESVKVDAILFWSSMGFGFPLFHGKESCGVEEQLLGYIDHLEPGETAEMNFTAPTEDVWGPMHLQFTLSPLTTSHGCPTASSNSATAIVLAEMKEMWQLGVPYIVIEKYASKTHVKQGEVFTITLHVSNLGTAMANDISITEKLPHGLSYVGNVQVNPPDKSPTCTVMANATAVIVNITCLAPGDTIDISFDVKAEEPGTYALSSSPYECKTPLGASINGFSEMLIVVVEESGAGGGLTPESLITPMALGVASIIATLAIGLYLARRRSS